MTDLLDLVAHALGEILLRRAEGPRLAFVTPTGVRLYSDDPDVKSVHATCALPPGRAAATDEATLAAVRLRAWVEAHPGDELVVVYESGAGLVASRARVEAAPRTP